MNGSDTLDGVDQRIVAALQVHPRAGVSEIGRVLREHERSVARRVQRLVATSVIHPTARYDPPRCGLGHTVVLRLRTARGCLEEVARGLARRREVHSVAAVAGESAHLWCELVVGSRSFLHSLPANGLFDLDDAEVLDAHLTLHPFKTEAQWYAPVLTEEEEKRLRASLVRPLPGRADRHALTPHALTPTDRRIADALISNARVSLTDLAKEVGFSTATAGRRVTSLLERRMLHLYTVVEPALLGRPVEARLRLRVQPSALEPVGTALADRPDVRSCTAVTGRYHLLVDVCVPHESDLYGFIRDELGAHPGILDVGTELVTRVYQRDTAVDDTPDGGTRS